MRTCCATRRITSAADEVFQCEKRMFHPRLANLLEARVIIHAAAHPIKILWNEWVISLRQLKPVNRLVAIVARVGSYCQTNLCGVASLLVHVLDISNDDI